MERITSRRNDRIIHMKMLGADRAFRRASGEFLCDGAKLLAEAAAHGAVITAVFTSGAVPESIRLPSGTPVYETPQELLNYVSPLSAAQDVLFTCKIPERPLPEGRGGLIILEGIQDPGNVGSVIRTANAFGIGSVLLTGACADPYNPKTVRATMGAIFRQSVRETDISGIKALKAGGIKLYGAALGDNCRDIRLLSLDGAAVVIGNEGGGLSEEMLTLCDMRVIIPMSPECESLNAAVAAAVIMWEMSGKK